MAFGFAGTWVDCYGARNVHQGEYDTSECRTFVFGVPLLLLFRGFYHVLHVDQIKDTERLECIRRFGQKYLGWVDLPRNEQGEIVWDELALAEIARAEPHGIPLKRSLSLMGMAIFHWGLFWGSASAIFAGVITYAFCTMQRPMDSSDRLMLVIAWGIVAFVIAGLFVYRWLRKPSARQQRIRTIVAQRLGPFSDPADWLSRIGEQVLPEFNLHTNDPQDVAEEANKQLQEANYGDALVLARLGLSLARTNNPDRCLLHELQTITDGCRK